MIKTIRQLLASALRNTAYWLDDWADVFDDDFHDDLRAALDEASSRTLERLADEALDDYRKGLTTPMPGASWDCDD